jgi:hypothetical protein
MESRSRVCGMVERAQSRPVVVVLCLMYKQQLAQHDQHQQSRR